MKTIDNIAVFDNEKCFLAMLKGYCYANNIVMTELDFNVDGVNKIEKLKPDLIMVSLNFLSATNKNFETGLLKRVCTREQIKICGLNKSSTDIISFRLFDWIDMIINDPFDIGSIGEYIKKNYLIKSCFIENRRYRERRSFRDRRSIEYSNNSDNGYKVTRIQEFKDFQIDHRNRCLFLKGHKVDLTPKEFELIEFLLTDVDRIFTAEEIINHLWPESNRATKSDLYQYMHLLRKKIEEDPNKPQWIINVKGFGYKLNVLSKSDEINSEGYLPGAVVELFNFGTEG